MDKLLRLIEDILHIEKGSIDINTKIEDIQEWDSLANIQIIAEIEEEFNISIPIEDINSIKEIKDFIKYI